MPRKQQNRALLTKPSSSAPSTLASNRTPSSNNHGAPSTPTVNELLRESRKATGAVQPSYDVSNLASLPPSLRAVLNMPTPASPPPRTPLRGPARVRRIPGPPPPQSWLLHSEHASDAARSAFSQLRWLRARIQQQSSTLPGSDHFPSTRSLEHLTLKAIATNWHWHAEYDHTYLASTLPVSIRMTLLSYLAVYNEAHGPNPFPVLFPDDCDQNELDAVHRLDLTNSLGSWATVKKIEKELVSRKCAIKADRHVNAAERASDDVPDTWDADLAPAPVSSPSYIQNHLRFTNLKHLSLAVNSASSSAPASWASLMSLSSHLSRLTSLSLAHWPNPTYTPNAANGRVRMVNTAVPTLPHQIYGGSDMYTAFDNNWREAAGILRSLSRNLYCLTWLDLSGCAPWLIALTWRDEDGELVSADFHGAWRNLETMILSVGWLPGRPPSIEDEISSTSRSTSSMDSTRAIEQLYGGRQAIRDSLEAIASMRIGQPQPPPAGQVDPPWNVELEREKQYFRRDVERYVSQQNTAKHVAGEIKQIRKDVGARRIDFDFGEVLSDEMMKAD